MDEVVEDVDMPRADLEGEELASAWREKFSKGELSSQDFENRWKTWVPRIYAPRDGENCLVWKFDEELAQRMLYEPLGRFACDGDPETVLARVNAANRAAASVCGKIFKMSESTYYCSECGTDNTCVLCVDCFRKSKHRFHKYKISASMGGGCCDCGDNEAWKRDPYCEAHEPSAERAPSAISEEFRQRVLLVFETTLWYAYSLLSTEHVTDIRFPNWSVNLFDIDTYCTILYNDEVHTFEQVISTLLRVLKCSQRNAIAFVTNIDREGRAVVKCANFQQCNELRQEIEKYTTRHGSKALKVAVIHSHIIAHQIFAMKLLVWLQTFLDNGEELRAAFAEVALRARGAEPCIVKGVMLRDASLWKGARIHWHRLLIAGMLREYESKMRLAKIFTKNYPQIAKDFILDDHDYSFSISSLSVQLFTVPTIARRLIAEDDVLFALLNAFLSECAKKCNKMGKLEFERAPVSVAFKHATHMLLDFKYLLNAVPDSWSDDLRRSFLHGTSCLYDFLLMMEGMDAATRQVGQHLEYEPEWETAFNVLLKLLPGVSLSLKWCASDRVVLIKAYKNCLRKLHDNPCTKGSDLTDIRELAGHSAECIRYDVALMPVSIHYPLTRFWVGLHLQLHEHNLSYAGVEFSAAPKPTPVQLIEPVLRSQVLIAQLNAGMWRRNGYGLLSQIFFFQNAKFRTEMYDRDICALQIGASLIDHDEFLIHVLNKYNLLGWANVDFETNSLRAPEDEHMRQTVILVEEFLELVIAIVGERFVPGISDVTPVDRLKKEIMQLLCIKRFLHSDLMKKISEDVANEVDLDEIIKELAEFKRDPSTGKGVYELKSEYYDQYNVFYYHYSREELSKSEENQRERQATGGKLKCCPPPKLPMLSAPFRNIVNIMQCDVMLHVIKTVLKRCANLFARSFSEFQLHKVLHLIGYALQEEESGNYPAFKFVEKSARFDILGALEALLACPRVDLQKDLLRWTIAKFKEVANDAKPTAEPAEPCGEQKSKGEKERRAKLAAERREKIMAQMKAMQSSFMKENAQLFEEAGAADTMSKRSSFGGSAMDVTVENALMVERPVALGPEQTAKSLNDKHYTCILCQEEECVLAEGPVMVLAALVHESTVLMQNRTGDIERNNDLICLEANLAPTSHVNTCGHAMHADCWTKFYEHVMTKEQRRPYRLRHPSSFNVDKQEFLCPLCESLSNTVIPIIPPLSALQPRVLKDNAPFERFVEFIDRVTRTARGTCHGDYTCDHRCPNAHCDACRSDCKDDGSGGPVCDKNWSTKKAKVFYQVELRDEFYERLVPQKSALEPSLHENYHKSIELFVRAPIKSSNDPHAFFKSIAYGVHAVEMLLRQSNKALLGELSARQREGLECLIKLGAMLKPSATETVTLLKLLTEAEVSIFHWDSFGLLVALTYAMQSLTENPGLPTGGTLESHLLRLIFTCHLVKISIQTCLDSELMKRFRGTDEAMDTDDNNALRSILTHIHKESFDFQALWAHMQKLSEPFLRCCALFYHYLTEVPPSAELQEIGGDTFSIMCAYLGIPEDPNELFAGKEMTKLLNQWFRTDDLNLPEFKPLIQIPLQPNRLVDLPDDYSELINWVSSFTCPKSQHEDARNPAMCLVCGKIVCSQSYCCQTEHNKLLIGACNYHAYQCGANVGIFLRVRDCEILLLAAPHRGCFLPAPYLDDYGETDQGLKRGNPLRLSQAQYQKLQNMWASHGVLENIARVLESTYHSGASQWHHL